jgi:hypothetical protein
MAAILGDSNVIKYLPLLKEKKSDPSIQATNVSRATNAVLLQDLLSNPKTVHALVIISAMTNLITSKFFDDYDQLIDHCRKTFTDVLLWIQEGREALSGFAETVHFCVIHHLSLDVCHRYMQLFLDGYSCLLNSRSYCNVHISVAEPALV